MPLSLKTWLYFAIMAVIMMLLLWLFQFVFFNELYYQRQEEHLKSVSAELLALDYSKPNNWSEFEPAAKEQNINIYVFCFNINDIKQSADGMYTLPSSAQISVYTPYYTNNDAKLNTINWTNSRLSEYLSNLRAMDENKEFAYYEDSESESLTKTLIYGGELKGTPSANYRWYFCMVATVSTSNYNATLFQNLLITASVVIFVVSIVMSLLFSRRLSDPINRLALTANKLAKGNFDVEFKEGSCAEVEQLAVSLNYAKEELSKTDQMRRDFIANVSHDLRTPLTMIQAYAEMVRDLSGNVPEKRTKHCQIIIDETKRLSLLVADINNLSKLQSGTDSFNVKLFDISELCAAVVQRFGIMSETQGYVFKVDCTPGALCYGDYQKIEQVLYNLIGNALNYTGEDKNVTVRCVDAGDRYKVEITDTGKGIAPEDIPAVWDRYYRINQKKRNVVGSGLGLNIVKIILDGHKAEYGIDSELNKGTTFWFKLKKEQKTNE